MMAQSDAQKRASRRYVAEKVKRTDLRFYQSEADIWEHLMAQGNRQGYIKRLIREDMERGGSALG